MMWLKGCPRCLKGDVAEDRDLHGAYLSCVQCGHILNKDQEAKLRGAAARK